MSICRLGPEENTPEWVYQASFYSISKTTDELSIVCDQSVVPDGIKSTGGWRAFVVQGPLDFSLTGILSSLTAPLAESEIPVFAISTFDTDYLLVPPEHFERARQVLHGKFVLSERD